MKYPDRKMETDPLAYLRPAMNLLSITGLDERGIDSLGDSENTGAGNFARRVRDHVKFAARISEMVKGRLSMGARILRKGGVEKIFRQMFSVGEGEKLLKTCHCCLSTTAGPIAGLLFISTSRVSFCSERLIKVASPTGEILRLHYKVSIPSENITNANQSKDVDRPSRKYIELVTVDNFDFWFMGFLSYKKAFKCLQRAINRA